MNVLIRLEQELNKAISGMSQTRDPIGRALVQGDVLELLQRKTVEVADARRRAIAEAIAWPHESLATVAEKLNISKSAVAKLAPRDIRDVIATEVRERLARGFNPPPLAR